MANALFDLYGKKALVTGASRGIGYTIAVELAKQGVDLIVTSRNHDDLDAVLRAAQNEGRTAHALSADLNQHVEVVRLAEEALGIWPALAFLLSLEGPARFLPANPENETAIITPAIQPSYAFGSR